MANNQKATMDEINLDTLLSGETLLNEWNAEGYEDLIQFTNNFITYSTEKPISMASQRTIPDQVQPVPSRDLNNNKANSYHRSIIDSSLDEKTSVNQQVDNKNKGKISCIEQSSKVAMGRRKPQTLNDEYSISTESGDTSTLFSTRDQRNEIMKSIHLTKDASRKIQSRMSLLAKESCGVLTSTQFHPYMALPDEVSMQKIGSYFPLLDLISSTTVAQDTQSIPLEIFSSLISKCSRMKSKGDSDTTIGQDINACDSSDVVLLQIFRKYLGIRCDASNSSNVSVKAGSYAPSNMKSIALTINELENINKNQLALELEDAWRLVQRQRVFFKRNLNNLAHWCKTNFTPEMSASLFSAEKVYSNTLDEQSSLPSNAGAHAYATAIGASLDSLTSFYSPPFTEDQNIYCRSDTPKLLFVNIIVEDSEQETFPRLLAILGPQDVKLWNHNRRKPLIISRKRKLSPTHNDQIEEKVTKAGEINKPSAITKSNGPKLNVSSNTLTAPPNNEFNPDHNRISVSSILTKTAIDLETQIIERDKKRRLDFEPIDTKIGSSDSQTTKELWDVLQKQYYVGTVSQRKANDELVIAFNPELPSRETYWKDYPTPTVFPTQNETNINPDVITTPSSSSLYHRLQSLLVEDSIDEGDVDNEEVNSFNGYVGHAILLDNRADDIVDVSGLTLDQRAYIHLRAAKLIDQPFWEEKPKIINEYSKEKNSSASNGTLKQDYEDLDDVIRKRQMELSKKHRFINETASHLLTEASIEPLSACMLDDSVIIDNYNQLMKKEIEKKKANTCRVEGDLPW